MKVLLGFLGVGLLIYAVIDCSRTPEEEVPASLPRSGWLVLIILLPFLGPLFWLFTSRTEGTGASTGSNSPAARPGRPPLNGPPRNGPARKGPPLGPDDDPDFLRGL